MMEIAKDIRKTIFELMMTLLALLQLI